MFNNFVIRYLFFVKLVFTVWYRIVIVIVTRVIISIPTEDCNS